MSASSRDLNKMDVENKKEEGAIAIDGFNQVLEMLRIADPAFRESLLRRLAQRDQELARDLRRDLGL
ncbi:MAG TPA: hypothetical protein DCS07_16455 [Bdellovibrionales bacterium]|nr:MAG: hypothetical protein A2Z97_15795 [Bdellovibrionales bacterium GWB1_52_6]OFZ06425.1 MAG: hypothetical protein A2X97_03120 [Bdellovibrionales bacterium GWA1_52_35]OFZ40054.1 MAG: hypothetical protein A2070_02460 [Bdellovibrionales bacterium GWC1_52_8]HAR44197.1 hypothetical protein [Bdellovibrionales bacterium]HCM40184.1 hypothetical protein [Bdellovibrionales bacterium]